MQKLELINESKNSRGFQEKFVKEFSSLTGVPKKVLSEYSDDLLNVLEHPNIIDLKECQIKRIACLNEFIRTYELMKLQRKESVIRLSSTDIAGKYFLALFNGIKDKEILMVSFLDSSLKIIATEKVFEGTITEVVIYPRKIVKLALNYDCKSLILAHNHPAGSMRASSQDVAMTKKIVSALEMLDISVIDHIITGDSDHYSMAENGMM